MRTLSFASGVLTVCPKPVSNGIQVTGRKEILGKAGCIGCYSPILFYPRIADAATDAPVQIPGNKELGLQLGRMMGDNLRRSGRFYADALVPLPLFVSKEKRRGFNQATILCEGMARKYAYPGFK
ncbi:MAG: hypothetical protein WDO16_11275 [Bacteroidota bacterium]